MPLTDKDIVEAFEVVVPEVARQHATPGLNLAIARHGEVIWEAGEGYADLELQAPMTPETVNRSGSMGKVYTATAVMQLVERGIIDLHERADAHLPFDIDNPLGGGDVTVWHLLTHTSGLMGNGACSSFDEPTPLEEHLAEDYARGHVDFYPQMQIPTWSAPVGEKPQYSNTGIATLGLIVANANPEGLAYSEYVQRHVMDPLGMTSSQYPPVQNRRHIRPELFERLSTGYAQLGSGVHVPTPPVYFADHPAGTALITPGDHVRLLLAYLEGGTLDGHELLREETVEQMLTGQEVSQLHEGIDLGLVWMLRGVGTDLESFGHNGAHMWGWTNSARAFRKHRTAIVVSANHWNLFEGLHAARYAEGDDLTAFLAWLLATDRPPSQHRGFRHPWAWKVSYVTGLVAANRYGPYLGIERPLTQGYLDAMVGGARVLQEGRGGARLWDADGFRAGVEDLSQVEHTIPATRAFLLSDRVQVSPAEMHLINGELLGPIGGAVVPGTDDSRTAISAAEWQHIESTGSTGNEENTR
ncbi:MAG TPA: serine hydrolase domain-containing protein [Nitriliruptorales bacterium]